MTKPHNNNPKAIKILVASHSGEIGGAELAMLDMLDYLTKQLPLKLHFVLPWDKGGLDARLKRRGWEYSVVPYSVWSMTQPLKHKEDIYRENQKNIDAVRKIIRVIDKVKPNIVLSNSVVCPWAAIASAQRPVRHIWYVHEYGDLGLNLEFELGREKSLSDVGWFSDLVIANSLTIKEHLSKYIENRKVHTAYIPYDFEKIKNLTSQKRTKVFGKTNDLKLILLGRVVATKGQLDAVNAVGELKKQGVNVKLCLLGTMKHDPYYVKMIKNSIKKYGIKDRVILVDHADNPFPYIQEADVGLTSSHHEAFGRTTFEYMMLGKAVIGTTDTGATKELVREGINGFGYHFEDSKTLAKHIAAYAADRQLLEKHSKQAADVVDDILNGANSPKHLAKLIKTLASKPANQKLPNLTEKVINFAEVSESYRRKREPESYPQLRRIYHSKPFKPAKAVIKPIRQARTHKKNSKR